MALNDDIMAKFYITTPIYYVNDKPHIGHAYTTIAADVLARYHRLIGDEVLFLTGTDEHGSKIAESAKKAEMTPQEFCDQTSAKFSLAWDELDISNDDFIRTTEQRHITGVKNILNKLKESGAIYEGEYKGLYCVGCERFLTEKELIDGKCPIHKTEPQQISEKNYFFNLKKFLPRLEKMIDQNEIKILPDNRRKEVLGLFKQGMDDFSVSRESVKWGIPLPFDENQVAYVWVDALSNYLTALDYSEGSEKLKKFWPADLHLMAKDILKFHALYWPAMLMALGEELPKTIFAHGFFMIDGEKMSKSLGNFIDPHDLVAEFGSDAVRYLLLSQFPFGVDGDVKLGNFAIQYNSDLANGIGNLTSRVLAMVEKYFNGVVPAEDGGLSGEVGDIWSDYQKAMAEFRVDLAIEAIRKLISIADGYVDVNKPWELAKSDQEKLAKVIYNLLEVLRHLALMLYPVMPECSQKILSALGKSDFTSLTIEELKKWGGLVAGSSVAKSEQLFPRLVKAE